MVSARLVETLAADARAGRCTAEEAALELARPCVCGAFNPARAAWLLKRL